MRVGARKFIPCLAVQRTAMPLLISTAPLFEKEGRAVLAACGPYLTNPRFFHRPSLRSRLATNDSPVDRSQVNLGNRAQERLERNESDGSPRRTQMIQAIKIVRAFDTDTQPYIRKQRQ